MRIYNILELNEKLTIELRTIAKELGIRRPDAYKKDELIYKILDEQAILEAKNKNSESYQSEDRIEQQQRKSQSAAKNKQERPKNQPQAKKTEQDSKPADASPKKEEPKPQVKVTPKEAPVVEKKNEPKVVIEEKEKAPQKEVVKKVEEKEKEAKPVSNVKQQPTAVKPTQLVFRSNKVREAQPEEPVPGLPLLSPLEVDAEVPAVEIITEAPAKTNKLTP